jgi:hypothetical protein
MFAVPASGEDSATELEEDSQGGMPHMPRLTRHSVTTAVALQASSQLWEEWLLGQDRQPDSLPDRQPDSLPATLPGTWPEGPS